MSVEIYSAGARAGHPQVDLDTAWTIPNLLTLLRFMGVPLFVWLVAEDSYGYGVLVLAVMGSTDWIDGYIARRFGSTSRLGRVLDPVADRLALVVVAITLVAAEIAPWWLVAALLIPDVVLISTTAALFGSNPDLPISRVGKIRTAFLLLGTPLLLLAHVPSLTAMPLLSAAVVLLCLGCVGHWIAAYNYWWALLRKYQAAPPAPRLSIP